MRSAIGRPIDPRYPTNLAIVAISGIAFAAALTYSYLQGALDVRWAIGTAAAGFLAWAIARELDPDHPYSAFLATTLVLGISMVASASLAYSFWVLLTVRILNRTPGTPTTVDALITAGLALYVSAQGFWIAAPLTALAFVADGRLPDPTDRIKFAPIPLVGLVLAWPIQLDWQPSWIHLALAFAVPLLAWSQISSLCDRGTPLQPTRIQAAVVLGALAVLFEPAAGVAAAGALVGAGAWRLGLRVAKR